MRSTRFGWNRYPPRLEAEAAQEKAQLKLDEREDELAAREAILRKRYGSGKPRGRPAEYSDAQIREVHRLSNTAARPGFR